MSWWYHSLYLGIRLLCTKEAHPLTSEVSFWLNMDLFNTAKLFLLYISFNVSFGRYFLFLSELTKKKLQEDIDEFSDSYYQDLDLGDIKQVIALVFVLESYPLFLLCSMMLLLWGWLSKIMIYSYFIDVPWFFPL